MAFVLILLQENTRLGVQGEISDDFMAFRLTIFAVLKFCIFCLPVNFER